MKPEGNLYVHADLLEGEMSFLECLCLSAWVGITRDHLTQEAACEKYGITIEQYDANIEKALS